MHQSYLLHPLEQWLHSPRIQPNLNSRKKLEEKISLKQDEKSVRSSRLTETLPAAPKTDIFSPRVDTVTSLITMIRKTAPDEKCLVVSSSVMFLDIVDEALRRTYQEHQSFRLESKETEPLTIESQRNGGWE